MRFGVSIAAQAAVLFLLFRPCAANASAADAAAAYRQGDYAGVMQACADAAKAGDASCANWLGILYSDGKGVKPDAAAAARWFRIGAEQGNATAAYNLGQAYEHGKGVAKDIEAAEKWYEAAAGQGFPYAQLRLAIIAIEVHKDWKTGVKWLRPAAGQGLPAAEMGLGFAYESGGGVRRNDRLAAKWYALAADHGETDAQSRLASLYERGAGVETDYKESYFWYAVALRDPKDATAKEDAAGLKRVGAKLSASDRADAAKLAAAFQPEEAVIGKPQRGSRSRTAKNAAHGPQLYATGTGFYVGRNGTLITNNHVVDQCAEMRISDGDKGLPARVVAVDPERDLALLQSSRPVDAVAIFRGSDTVKLGENIVVVGFPLAGLLSSDPIVTSGIVSALAGMRDNRRQMQISAPIQPGNSGGPLFDANGRIAGVVVATLDTVKLARAIGVVPENVNFAIKGDEARQFLTGHGVAVETTTEKKELSTAAIAEQALKITVRLECWR